MIQPWKTKKHMQHNRTPGCSNLYWLHLRLMGTAYRIGVKFVRKFGRKTEGNLWNVGVCGRLNWNKSLRCLVMTAYEWRRVVNAVMNLSALHEYRNDYDAMEMATHFAENVLISNWIRQSRRGHRSLCRCVPVSGFRIELDSRFAYSVYLNDARFTVTGKEQNYIKAL